MFPKTIGQIDMEVAELTARSDGLRESCKLLNEKIWKLQREKQRIRSAIKYLTYFNTSRKLVMRLHVKTFKLDMAQQQLEATSGYLFKTSLRIDDRIHRLQQIAIDMERAGM